jgi:hypothetical protein
MMGDGERWNVESRIFCVTTLMEGTRDTLKGKQAMGITSFDGQGRVGAGTGH